MLELYSYVDGGNSSYNIIATSSYNCWKAISEMGVLKRVTRSGPTAQLPYVLWCSCFWQKNEVLVQETPSIPDLNSDNLLEGF